MDPLGAQVNQGLRFGFLTSSPILTPLLFFSGSARHPRFSRISGKWRGMVSCVCRDPWSWLDDKLQAGLALKLNVHYYTPISKDPLLLAFTESHQGV